MRLSNANHKCFVVEGRSFIGIFGLLWLKFAVNFGVNTIGAFIA